MTIIRYLPHCVHKLNSVIVTSAYVNDAMSKSCEQGLIANQIHCINAYKLLKAIYPHQNINEKCHKKLTNSFHIYTYIILYCLHTNV